MKFSIQPVLGNGQVVLQPLQADDFEALYAAAADPAVWAQHPNKDRWKREVFQNFFEGALQSRGAFKIVDRKSGAAIGSTRFYDYNETDKSIFIGYTFYARAWWGRGVNPAVKALMLDYIFGYVNTVLFHIGAQNIRSQVAITRLGAEKIGEEEVAYFGEPTRANFLYAIRRDQWSELKGRLIPGS